MFYYIEKDIQGNVTGKGEISVVVPLNEYQTEVTEEEYNHITFSVAPPNELRPSTAEQRISDLEIAMAAIMGIGGAV